MCGARCLIGRGEASKGVRCPRGRDVNWGEMSGSRWLNSNIWAGYSPRLQRTCYAPATRPLLAVDLHVWFSQDEEIFHSTSPVTR